MAQVLFPSRLSRQLYKNCRRIFPNEEYAILLGSQDGDETEIEELYFPPDRLENLSPDFVFAKMSWFVDAGKLADALGLEILGEIHSHCYDEADGPAPGTEPSELDWDRGHALLNLTGGGFRLMGIVRVLKKGEKLT